MATGLGSIKNEVNIKVSTIILNYQFYSIFNISNSKKMHFLSISGIKFFI